jgi:hypothetical protein
VNGASHEEAVALLTTSYPAVTLAVSRERVLEKRMTPLSKHREDSLINKRIAEKEMIQDAMIRASAGVRDIVTRLIGHLRTRGGKNRRAPEHCPQEMLNPCRTIGTTTYGRQTLFLEFKTMVS